MKIDYDESADAAYISLLPIITEGVVERTYTCNPEEVGGEINLDFDGKGRLIGIEVLDARQLLPTALLPEAKSD